MSAPESKEEYIEQLEQKYHTILPTTMEGLEKEMEHLQKLHKQLINERNDIGLEIDYLSKSVCTEFNILMELPWRPWANVIRFCGTQENAVLDACNAWKDFDERVIRDCPGVKDRLVLKNAFAVLVRNCYLDRDDLLSCLNSKCQTMENSAAAGYRYLKKTKAGAIVSFTDSKTILKFMEDVRGKENIWEAFVWKRFELDGTKLYTMEEKKDFLTTFQYFLGEFGKFIFYLKIQYMDWMGTEKIFFPDLFCILPNFIKFDNYQGHYGPSLELRNRADESNPRTFEPFFEISTNPDSENDVFFEATGKSCRFWRVDYDRLPSFSPPEGKPSYRNIKILELNVQFFRYKNYKKFIASDFSGFTSLEKIILRGTETYFLSLALLKKFPQAKEVTLVYCVNLPPTIVYDGQLPPRSSFEFIKKLTLDLSWGHPVPLDDISNLLPSLRSFCLSTEWNKPELEKTLADYLSRGHFENHVIDLYEFYAEKRRLSGSNIWRHMNNLKTLTVETVVYPERFPEDGMILNSVMKRREIYTKGDKNVIKMYEIISPY